jgi:transposase
MENTIPQTDQETAAAQPGTAGGAGRLIRTVQRETRHKFTSEEKIRIVLEGFRKEIPVSDLCRREGIWAAIYYKWLRDFMEAGKARLKGDSLREANREEVTKLKRENDRLKAVVGEVTLENYVLKKSVLE